MKKNQKRTINLIMNNPVIFQPENYEWPHMTIDGKDVELRPFMALSIMPATGWQAVFAREDGTYKKPLAVFALVQEDDGTQDIIGISACCEDRLLDNPENYDHFLGYEGPKEDVDWTEEWREWHIKNSCEFKDMRDFDIHTNDN